VVPRSGEEAVETARQSSQLPQLQMGHSPGVLELLRVVQRAGRAQVNNPSVFSL
jgi:hypothetical protein